MPYLTVTEKSKATNKLRFSCLLNTTSSLEKDWVYSGRHTRMHAYLLVLDERLDMFMTSETIAVTLIFKIHNCA